MRNRFLAFTTVFSLLFGMSCFNCDVDLTAFAVTENDDVTTTTTTTAHVHNWVDVTETRTIHHDAEYATRTYWDKPCFYHGCQNLTDAHLTVPGRYGDWMNYGWEESTVYMAPTFDILLWKYGTPSNFPSYVQQFHSVEECDNFFGFSDSVVFCSTNPMTGSHVPDFNPATDIILTYDNYDLDNDAWNDLHGSAVSWDFWMYNNSLDEVYPVFQEQIKVRDAWDETTTVVVGHKCTSCGATKEDDDSDSSTPDSSSKPDDSSSKTDDNSSKPDDSSSKTDDNSSKPDDSSSKTDDSSNKPDDSSSKTDDNSSKPDDSSSKTDDSSSKPDDSSVSDDSNSDNFLLGDVNADGRINVTDITMTAAHVKGLKNLNEDQRKRADADKNGSINVVDVTKIAAHVKGIQKLPSA